LPSSWRKLALLTLVSGLLCVQVARGQKGFPDKDDSEVEPPWVSDPYFKGDRDAWIAAGYAPVLRLPFGDGHSSTDVEELLGEVKLLWVETAHFRLGSSLPEVKLAREERSGVRDELERLAERLPKISPKARSLDRHMRLHLYAQRLEEMYADFVKRVGPAAERFGDDTPHLGLRDKFPVLLLEKESSLGRYGNKYGQAGPAAAQRLNFHVNGTLGFATAWEFFEGTWKTDAALHGHVAWNIEQNLLCGYGGYTHVMPAWFQNGLGSWAQRRVTSRFPTYAALEGSSKVAADEWNWPPKVRARVGFDHYPTTEQMLGWRHGQAHPYSDYMMAWSKVEWLMAQSGDGGGFGTFVERISAPIEVPPGTVATEEQVAARCREALLAAWGLTPDELDAAWAAWVPRHYPKK